MANASGISPKRSCGNPSFPDGKTKYIKFAQNSESSSVRNSHPGNSAMVTFFWDGEFPWLFYIVIEVTLQIEDKKITNWINWCLIQGSYIMVYETIPHNIWVVRHPVYNLNTTRFSSEKKKQIPTPTIKQLHQKYPPRFSSGEGGNSGSAQPFNRTSPWASTKRSWEENTWSIQTTWACEATWKLQATWTS